MTRRQAPAPAGAGSVDERPSRPGLGTSYEGRDPALLRRILPLVDYIEVTPDSIAEVRGGRAVLHAATVDELRGIGSQATIIAHGVGLSIGSYDGYSRQYLRLLDDLMKQVDIAWHSEHLGYTTVEGEHLGTMLALPRTGAVLDMICERVAEIQQRYGIPFLLENIVHVLPDIAAEYSDAGFLNAIAERTGCGLLLDVYNLECDAHNHGFDIDSFLAELDLTHVREIHIAGGTELEGFMLDVHSRTPADSTIALAREVIRRAGGSVQVVMYELLPQAIAVLGHDVIFDELVRLRAELCA